MQCNYYLIAPGSLNNTHFSVLGIHYSTFPNQVEKMWSEIAEELPRLPSLEHLLLQQMVTNGCRETEGLGVCLKSLKGERALEIGKARRNKRKCQVWNYTRIN